MIAWTAVLLHLDGNESPSSLGPRASCRASLLRQWAEGDRRHVTRVTDASGNALAPADIDWSTMVRPPRLRAGAPVRTGRSGPGTQLLVRLSLEERAMVDTEARRARKTAATWVRDVALARVDRAARKSENNKGVHK